MATASAPKAKATAPAPTTTSKRCDASKVKVGHVFSRHSFGEVTRIDQISGQIGLKNTNSFEWTISRDILEQEFSFADQFDGELKVSRTRAIEIVTEHPATAMTIHFNKKVDPKAVADALTAGQGAMKPKEWQKHVEKLLEGEERVMIGCHFNNFDEHRRLKFEEHNVGQRLVDPRTLNWIVVERVRYIVE